MRFENSAQMTSAIAEVKQFLLSLQNDICKMVSVEESKDLFHEDEWSHASGGGGRSRIITGTVIEKGGVNFSHVHGLQLPPAATLKRPELANAQFQALGVSVVLHPHNPYAPTSHMNVRFILAEPPQGEPLWWFGGGFDLTPYYGFEEDCIHWHRIAKNICDPFDLTLYAKFKAWCDQYFYLPHRQEPRGIGGLFFDDLNQWGFERCFAFMQAIGKGYMAAYQPILSSRKQMPYTAHERAFQLYRRGRYVEFNLLYDRGTLFGLQSGGRTESILMSLPPTVTWLYDWQPEPGSNEAKLYEQFLQVKAWI